MDPISWLASHSIQLVILVLSLYLLYWLWMKRFDPQRRMTQTFLRSGLVVKESRGKLVIHHFPRLRELSVKDWGYVFKYELPPGLSFQQFLDKKPFIDVAFKGESTITGKGNLLKIEVTVGSLPYFVAYDPAGIRSAAASDHIPFILGRSGKGTKVLDLAEVPHCLVTGESGSGKSVFVRQLLTSLIMLRKPEQLQMTLIDLKSGLELGMFEQTPHVACFAGNINALENTLNFVRDDMNDRGEIFARSGCVDIHEYNRKHPEARLPFHIVVIDELADLIDMRIIERLLRRGRVYGVHLVMVAQRFDPSKHSLSFPMTVHFAIRNGMNQEPLYAGRAKVDFNGQLTVQGMFLSQAEAKQYVDVVLEDGRAEAGRVEEDEGEESARRRQMGIG